MFKLLLHKDVFYLKNAQELVKNLQRGIKELEYSAHINEHFNTMRDRSHRYCGEKVKNCINTLSTTPRDSFEIEISKDFRYFGESGFFVTKFCVRIPYEDGYDVVVVLRPTFEVVNNKRVCKGKFRVITAWINEQSDSHFTLDSSKYCSKEQWQNILCRGV